MVPMADESQCGRLINPCVWSNPIAPKRPAPRTRTPTTVATIHNLELAAGLDAGGKRDGDDELDNVGVEDESIFCSCVL